MSIYTTCPIEKVIAQIYRNFKPSNSGWIDDAVEWIADAAEIMKVYQNFTNIVKEINVVDYRAKLPCDIEVLEGIVYKGYRLSENSAITFPNRKNLSSNCDCKSKCNCYKSYSCHPVETYSLNPNYIQTSFKEGCIQVYYEGLETDCNGLPYILDDAVYRQALEWYVLAMMCLRGFKHPIVTYELAWSNWEKFYPRAQNRFKVADVDAFDRIARSWLGIARPVNRAQFMFNDIPEYYNSTPVFNPGDKVESFPVLGKNLNNE